MILALLLAGVLAADPLDTNELEIPQRYRVNTVAIITTETQDQINATCGKASKGHVTLACTKDDMMYMPNPCTYPEETNHKSYAHLLCHELGHLNGWHHAHE